MTDSETAKQPAAKGRPKLVVELKELDEIYTRFKTIFVLTNILTALLAAYVIARLLFQRAFADTFGPRLDTVGLSALMCGSIILCVIQGLCLRKTTQSSRRKIEELTFRDALTTVYNYRYLDRRLDEELRMARRFKTTLSVVYMDMDKFKSINDQSGHRAGNEILSQLGRFLKATSRATDLVGRMGGDEFLMILPNTDRNEAQIVSERIRKHIEETAFTIDHQAMNCVRVSMGVASFPYEAADKESLISAADQAMYRAKQSGGNRVCI